MPTRYGKYLKEAGFDVLSVANNHAGDFGDAGRESTRKTLDALGIKHAGSDKGPFSTTYLETGGKTVAFIGFAHNNIVPNVNDLNYARQLVMAADKKADIVVVSFHGGAEGARALHVPEAAESLGREPRGDLRAWARAVIVDVRLNGAVFSMSNSAPHLFADRVADFEQELRALLEMATPTGQYAVASGRPNFSDGTRLTPLQTIVASWPSGRVTSSMLGRCDQSSP